MAARFGRQGGYMSIDLIAKHARVSKATVSRVLNNEAGVSEELRERVKKAVRQRDYRPRVVSNRLTNVALIVAMERPVMESFAAGIFSGVAAYAFEHGIETSVVFYPVSRPRNQPLVQAVRERRCNAAILLFPAQMTDQLQSLSESGIPTMLVAGRAEIDKIGYVDTDSHPGAQQVVEHLIGLGHRRIGMLCGPIDSGDFDHAERLNGYQSALRQAGLAGEERWLIPHQPTHETPRAGYLQMQELLKRDPAITAVFANNDEMAYGAILACTESGRRVPEDISVTGFDDYQNSQFYSPPLTTFRQPITQMGYEAAKFVDTVSRGVIDQLPRRVLQGELITRKSTAEIARK